MTRVVRSVVVVGMCLGMCAMVQLPEVQRAEAHEICKKCWRACRSCRTRCTEQKRCKKHYFTAYGRYRSTRGYWTRGRHYHPRGWRSADGADGIPASVACAAVTLTPGKVGVCAAVGALYPPMDSNSSRKRSTKRPHNH